MANSLSGSPSGHCLWQELGRSWLRLGGGVIIRYGSSPQSQIVCWQLHRGNRALRRASGGGFASTRRRDDGEGAMGVAERAGSGGDASGAAGTRPPAGRWAPAPVAAEATIAGEGLGRGGLGRAVRAHAPPATRTAAMATKPSRRRRPATGRIALRSARMAATVRSAKPALGGWARHAEDVFWVMRPPRCPSARREASRARETIGSLQCSRECPAPKRSRSCRGHETRPE
jgi:hypothetical protein